MSYTSIEMYVHKTGKINTTYFPTFCLADIFLLKSVTPAGSVILERVIAFIGDFTFRGENKLLRYPFGGTTFVEFTNEATIYLHVIYNIDYASESCREY